MKNTIIYIPYPTRITNSTQILWQNAEQLELADPDSVKPVATTLGNLFDSSLLK